MNKLRKIYLSAALAFAASFLMAAMPTPPPNTGGPWTGNDAIVGAATDGTYHFIQTDTNGVVQVSSAGGGGGGTSSNFGAAFPSAGTAIGVKDSAGVNLTFLKVNASNGLVVDGSGVTQPVSIAASVAVTGTFFQATQPVSLTTLPALTAGAAVIGAVTQSGTWNIGTVTTLPALVAGSAVIGVVGNGQASTTSGQSGPLVQGAVTTAAPSYSNAQTDPLSLTTGGALRSDLTTIAGSAVLTGTGTGGAGAIRVTVSSDSSLAANQSANVAQINGVTPLMGNGVTGTGSQRVTLASDTSSNTNPLLFNMGQYGGNNVVTAGVNGVAAVGGNVAVASARTTNPVPNGGVDTSNLVRVDLLDVIGAQQTYGSGESTTIFSVGTGAAAVTDGTNGKTISLQPKEADFYVGFSAVSTTPTIQIEVSYDNVLFAIIPLTRVDNTAVSQQYASGAAFTPVVGGLWRGKTYGAPIMRVHLTAGSSTNTQGLVRVVYQPNESGAIVSPFAFTAASVTEAVGVANGQIFTGGIRTLTIPNKGSTLAYLYIDADTGTNTILLEGSQDYGTTFTSLAMQPLAGGLTTTSFSSTGTANIPQSGVWVADVSGMTQVRARCSAYTGGNPFGALKVVNIPSSTPNNSRKPTYSASVSGSVTATTNVLAIISGSVKTATIKRVTINGGTATTATLGTLTVIRGTVAAPAGGSTVTAATMQRSAADNAFSGSVLQGISVAITTAGMTSTSTAVAIPLPVETATLGIPGTLVYDFTNGGSIEGFQIPVATTNSLVFSWTGTTGGANFALVVEFTEE